jgi:hypothetical protein
MSALPDAPPALTAELEPGFFSKIFQNFKLSSAANGKVSKKQSQYRNGINLPAVASICPSGLRQL